MSVPRNGNFSMFGHTDNTTIAGALVEGGVDSSIVSPITNFNDLKNLANINKFDIGFTDGATNLSQITKTSQFRGYPTCGLFITSIVTTEPTNAAGDNGTATITFTGGTAPITYTLNGESFGSTTSPLVLTGLGAPPSPPPSGCENFLCTGNGFIEWINCDGSFGSANVNGSINVCTDGTEPAGVYGGPFTFTQTGPCVSSEEDDPGTGSVSTFCTGNGFSLSGNGTVQYVDCNDVLTDVTVDGSVDICAGDATGSWPVVTSGTVVITPTGVCDIKPWSDIDYTIVLTDGAGCVASSTFTLGESTFRFFADYMMITYEFTDGQDLDIRTRIVSPDVGQNLQSTYLGWALQNRWPSTGNTILSGLPNAAYLAWGGDNKGTGLESILFDINRFATVYPTIDDIIIDLRAFWYNTVGINPVNVKATMWRGGKPVKTGFVWSNPTAAASYEISSVGKKITSTGFPNKSQSSGERLATLLYSLDTGVGFFNNNDNTTPYV